MTLLSWLLYVFILDHFLGLPNPTTHHPSGSQPTRPLEALRAPARPCACARSWTRSFRPTRRRWFSPRGRMSSETWLSVRSREGVNGQEMLRRYDTNSWNHERKVVWPHWESKMRKNNASFCGLMENEDFRGKDLWKDLRCASRSSWTSLPQPLAADLHWGFVSPGAQPGGDALSDRPQMPAAADYASAPCQRVLEKSFLCGALRKHFNC